jgi:hypothetical protein
MPLNKTGRMREDSSQFSGCRTDYFSFPRAVLDNLTDINLRTFISSVVALVKPVKGGRVGGRVVEGSVGVQGFLVQDRSTSM